MSSSSLATDSRISDPKHLERLLQEVDGGYLAFRALRGSVADADRLASEAAWVCWRTRRLLLGHTGRRSLLRGLVLRGRASAYAAWLRAGFRACEDIALADGVRRLADGLVRELAGARTPIFRDWEAQALDRRLDELRRLSVRASHVHAYLLRQDAHLWQQFIPRSG